MLRPLRVLLAVALTVPLLAGTAGAEEQPLPWAVANHQHRQALLHRVWPADGVPGSMLVTTATSAVARSVADDEGGLVLGDRTVLLHVEPGTEAGAAGRVAAISGVIGVEPDRERSVARVPNDELYFGDQWSHDLANADMAWNTTTGDASVSVAVLDTGVDGRHADLRGNLVEQVDVSSGRPVVQSLGSDNDTCNVGHGTFVSGVVGALGNNSIGVAGVAWDVSIVDVALTSRASRCGILDSVIIAGLAYVTDPSRSGGAVDVVNLSLGGVAEACPIALQSELDTARDRGTLVVAAAGNDNQRIAGATSIPASCQGVMSIGAVGDGGDIAPYSNENAWVDVAAPGGDSSVGRGIVSTAAGGGYDEEEGTSFAAPYVAGIAALLRSVEPSLTPDDLESIIERTASYDGARRDDSYGWGLVDAGRAVAAADDDPEPPEDDPSFPISIGGVDVERVSASGTSTDAIRQAVAISEDVFGDDGAAHAVLARSDDFADVLAGSALGFGVGPVLFSGSTGPLPGVTKTELERTLVDGSTVYLLGGTSALPATLEAEIEALGFVAVRVAGTTRQLTAVAVAEQLESYLAENEFIQPNIAVIATAFNWPDAVSAGALGAWFGVPILVTSATSLDEPVRAFLAERSWETVYLVGGTAALSEDVRRAARDAARVPTADAVRLAGVDRSATAVAIGTEFERLYSEQFEVAFGQPAVPPIVAAVNMRRADGFAHVLSASMLIGAFAGVFLPVEGDGGTSISAGAQTYACRFPAAGVVVGAVDLISDDIAELFDALLKGNAAACN